MIQQVKIELKSRPRGCHWVTREIMEQLPKPLPEEGLLNLFVQHTSCALSINENADPDVRTDLAKIMDHLVRENEPYYNHTLEGADEYAGACQVLDVWREPDHPPSRRGASIWERGREFISASFGIMAGPEKWWRQFIRNCRIASRRC